MLLVFLQFLGFGGLWGMLAVGLFAEKDVLEGFSAYAGVFHGGGFYLLGFLLSSFNEPSSSGETLTMSLNRKRNLFLLTYFLSKKSM